MKMKTRHTPIIDQQFRTLKQSFGGWVPSKTSYKSGDIIGLLTCQLLYPMSQHGDRLFQDMLVVCPLKGGKVMGGKRQLATSIGGINQGIVRTMYLPKSNMQVIDSSSLYKDSAKALSCGVKEHLKIAPVNYKQSQN